MLGIPAHEQKYNYGLAKYYIFKHMEFESNLLFGGGISVDISVVSISVVVVVVSKKKKKETFDKI